MVEHDCLERLMTKAEELLHSWIRNNKPRAPFGRAERVALARKMVLKFRAFAKGLGIDDDDPALNPFFVMKRILVAFNIGPSQ
jgi:hypothetical protein